MIRLTYLLRRKPGANLADFQSHFLNEYGPLLAGHSNHLATVKCVLNRTATEGNELLGGTRGQMETPYDAAVEIWWNNMASLTAALERPEGQRATKDLLAAEREFVDLPNSPLWFAYEYPQVNPAPESAIVARERSSVAKFYYPLRHLKTLSLDEAQLYWRTQHGPVIRSQANGTRTLRYVQVHRFETPLEDAWRTARGTVTETYTGHAELWFDRTAAAAPAPSSDWQSAASRAEEDERNFIDFTRSGMWWAKEHVLMDRI